MVNDENNVNDDYVYFVTKVYDQITKSDNCG